MWGGAPSTQQKESYVFAALCWLCKVHSPASCCWHHYCCCLLLHLCLYVFCVVHRAGMPTKDGLWPSTASVCLCAVWAAYVAGTLASVHCCFSRVVYAPNSMSICNTRVYIHVCVQQGELFGCFPPSPPLCPRTLRASRAFSRVRHQHSSFDRSLSLHTATSTQSYLRYQVRKRGDLTGRVKFCSGFHTGAPQVSGLALIGVQQGF